MSSSLSRADVARAARELDGIVRRTPTLNVPAIDDIAGCHLWLKAENLQHIGAFKARGAMLAAGRLEETERARGLITYSSGNHAQAVAFAAQRFGVAADIFMPTDAPRVKVAAVERMGARIHFAGTTSPERKSAALAHHEKTHAPIIEPFDHPDTVCGQGTATLELLEDAGAPLDAVIVPVGGGGVSAGAALALEGTNAALITAEPSTADAFAQSLEAGHLVSVTPGPTLADGLKPSRIGALNFEILAPRVKTAVRVTDDELRRAMFLAMVHGKLVLEPSGAAPLAAALQGAIPAGAKNVGILCSGGNVDPTLLGDTLLSTTI